MTSEKSEDLCRRNGNQIETGWRNNSMKEIFYSYATEQGQGLQDADEFFGCASRMERGRRQTPVRGGQDGQNSSCEP